MQIMHWIQYYLVIYKAVCPVMSGIFLRSHCRRSRRSLLKKKPN